VPNSALILVTDVSEIMLDLYKYDSESEIVDHSRLWVVIHIWIQIVNRKGILPI